MGKREFTFPSADGKTQIHAVEWLPVGEVKAVLQICHGVAEYILRYEDFALFLNSKGIAVVGHDHIGHGNSVAPGAPRLYFGAEGSWNWVVADIESRRKLASQAFPGVPYFLMGHSMGSFLARTYLIQYPGQVDGAVIMGTGQMSPALITGGMLLAAVIGKLGGMDKPSGLVDKIAFGPYNKPFAPNRTDLDWLSKNPDNVDAYIADSLCGGAATPGLFREMLSGISIITDSDEAKKMNLHKPVLFISGAMDPVGDCSKGVEKAYAMFQKIGVEDVSIKLYPELRHEILNEDCREQVYADIFAWLCAKMPVNV